jgi:hypothetical protein
MTDETLSKFVIFNLPVFIFQEMAKIADSSMLCLFFVTTGPARTCCSTAFAYEGVMPVFGMTIERDGDAFGRAFESASEWEQNPEARSVLHKAVGDLVASGALLPQEAQDFEDTLITSQGKFQLNESPDSTRKAATD